MAEIRIADAASEGERTDLPIRLCFCFFSFHYVSLVSKLMNGFPRRQSKIASLCAATMYAASLLRALRELRVKIPKHEDPRATFFSRGARGGRGGARHLIEVWTATVFP